MTGNNESNFVFPSNNALHLDGIDDRVTLRSANELGLINSSFTVEAWVNINEFPSGQNDHPILGTDGHSVRPSENQALALMIRDKKPYMSFFGKNLEGTRVLEPKTWYHITYQYDAELGKQAIFVNGLLDSESEGNAPAIVRDGLVNIGRWFNNRYFNGSIDELRIWNRLLTKAEIDENLYKSLNGNENGLRAYYTFDSASNNIIDRATPLRDRTNNGNDGTLLDNRNFVPSEKEFFGNALSLNGIDGFVRTARQINTSSNMSVSVYAKSNTANWNGDGFLVNTRDGYALYPVANSKEIRFYIFSFQDGWVFTSFTPSSDFDLTQWHNYTGTFDGNTIRLYIDGDLKATHNYTGFIASNDGDRPLVIGHNESLNTFFDGSIDEVSVWNKALSETEINDLIIDKPLKGTETNLLGYYNFDYNGIVDRTNNNNNGSLVNGADVKPVTLNNLSQPSGNVLFLDGVDDRVSLGNPQSLNITGQITLEAWIKPNQLNSIRNIVARGYSLSPNGEVYLRILNGFYEVGSWNGQQDANARFAIPSVDTFDLGQWIHLAGVYDGTRWRLYRNGIERASSAITNQGAVPVDQGWAIGARGNGEERYFSGQIDEVRIWNRGLNQQEIETNFNRPLTGNESGLVGYYNFDTIKSDSPNTITDSSSSQNNGTLNNGNQNQNNLNNFLLAQINPSGNVLTLDGFGNYLAIPNSNAFNFGTNQNFTIESLVKVIPRIFGRDDNQSIIEKWSSIDGYPFVIRYSISTGRIRVARYDGSNNPTITSISSINDGQYHHIAFVKEGNQLRLYIDGILEGSTTDTTRNSTTNDSPLFIGRRGNAVDNYFMGEIDETRIWNRALTQQEIQANLNNTLTGNESGLTAYYDFEEKTFITNNPTIPFSGRNDNINVYIGNYGILNPPINDIRPLEESFPQSFTSITISDFVSIPAEENSTDNYELTEGDDRDNNANFMGYIEVKLNKPVADLPGLIINYEVTGTATLGEDFYISQTNLSTEDSNAPTNSLFIPQGADSGKIYISALPDSIDEDTETVTVTLLPQTEFGRFGGGFENNLFVTGTTQVTIDLQDNDNYTAGIAIADGFRQEATENNLIVANSQGVGIFKVKLTSQPTADVTITFNSSQGSLSTSTLTFNANNWDTYQDVTVNNITSRFNINASLSSDDNKYAGISQLIGVTNNSEDIKIGVTEGGEIQPVPLPIVSVFNLKDAVEGETEPGVFFIKLNQSAPMGGMIINYRFATNNATLGKDFEISSIGQVTIPEGEMSARVTITPRDDQTVNGNRSVTLTLVESTENYIINSDDQSATIALVDDDRAGLSIVEFINTSAIGISEDDALLLNIAVKEPTAQQETFQLTSTGAIARLAISLNQRPTANVTVTIRDANRPSTTKTLTFTRRNWNTVQELNFEMQSALNGTLQLEALTVSNDSTYNNKTIALPFLQDTRTVDRLITSENGDRVVFGVALTSQPSNNVNIQLDFEPNIITRENGRGLAPQTLRFNSNNWSNYQKVVIKGVDNRVYNSEGMTTPIRFTSNSQDRNYNNQTTDLLVVNQDNDNQETNVPSGSNNSEFIVTLNVINGTIQETADSFGQIEFNLNKAAPRGGLLVKYELNSGSAIAGEDFLTTFQLRKGKDNPLSVIPSNLQMIAPTFADLNNNGRLDLIVGHSLGFLYYENKGTSNNPNFVLNRNNRLSTLINGKGFRQLNPTFVDINGDGDLDLFIGSNQNNILFYENQGTANQPNFLARTGRRNPLNNLNIPSFSNLTFGDINRDGDLDLLVGTANGTLRYFENIGSVTNPNFIERTGSNNPFQQINQEFSSNNLLYKNLNNIHDVAPTLVDFNNDGNLDLFIGYGGRNLLHYVNIGTPSEPNFILETGSSSPFFSQKISSGFGKPTIADINNDGNLDFLVGQINGETLFLENTGIGTVVIPQGRTRARVQVRAIPDLIAENDETFEVRLIETGDQNYRYRLGGNLVVTRDFNGQNIRLRLDDTVLNSIVLKAGSELTFKRGSGEQTSFVMAFVTEDVRVTSNNTLVNITLEENSTVTSITRGDTAHVPVVATTATMTIIDNDIAGLKISSDRSQTNLITSDSLFITRENNPNSRRNFFVSLNSQPTAPVEVYFGSSDTTQGLVNGENWTRLVFTETDWNIPQSFTLTPVNNQINERNVKYQIVSQLVSEDLKYNDNVIDVEITTPYRLDNNTIGLRIENDNISNSILRKGTKLIFGDNAEGIVTRNVTLSSSESTLVNLERTVWDSNGLFNLRAFRLLPGGQDTQINTTAETLTIWNAIESGNLQSVQSKYNLSILTPNTGETINFGSSEGNFANNIAYTTLNLPSGSINDFSIKANGILRFTKGGTYTIAIGSDDGRFLQLKGARFTNVSAGSTGVGTDTIIFNNRGNGVTLGTFTVEDNAVIELNTFFWDRAGDDFYEISIAEGRRTTFAPNNFQLLDKNNTLGVQISSEALPSTGTIAFKEQMGTAININDIDDDQAEIIIVPPNDVISEGFANNYYSIQLATQPLGQVFITMTPDSNDIELNNKFAGKPLTIVFDQNNWDIPRLVHVTAVDDFEIDYQQTVNIDFAITSETDSVYANLSPQELQVVVEDNDFPMVSVQTVAPAIEGADPGYFIVTLDKPVPNVFGETGIVVNYTVSGSANTDNSINADIQPLTGTVRIAPGKTQSNLIAFPIDDFLVEGVDLKLTQSYNSATNQGLELRINADPLTVMTGLSDGKIGLQLAGESGKTTILSDGSELILSDDLIVTVTETTLVASDQSLLTVTSDLSDGNIGLKLNGDSGNTTRLRAGSQLVLSSGAIVTITETTLVGTEETSVPITVNSGLIVVNDTARQATLVPINFNSGSIEVGDTANRRVNLPAGAILSLPDGSELQISQDTMVDSKQNGTSVPVSPPSNSIQLNTDDIVRLPGETITVTLQEGNGYTVPFDGLFNLKAFRLLTTGQDTQLNSTAETLSIWNAIESGNLDSINNTYNLSIVKPTTGETINFGSSLGRFADNIAYTTLNLPSGSINDFSIKANGILRFKKGGTYTIAVGSDDGRFFQLKGATFTNVSSGSTGVGTDTIVFNNTGNSITLGTFTVQDNMVVELNAFFWDRGGGDSFEISIAEGSRTNFNQNNFQLLNKNNTLGVQISSNVNDTAPSEATLVITDNDTPGLRIVEMGTQTQVVEGETTQILVSLLSQPEAPVTVNLPAQQTKVNLITTSSFSPNNGDGDNKTGKISLKLDSTTLNASELQLEPDSINSLSLSKGTVIEFGDNVTAIVDKDILLSPDQVAEVSLTLTKGNDITSGQLGDYSYSEYLYLLEDGREALNQTLTFTPENWYELQTMTIKAIDDKVAEKGEFHKRPINYMVTSDDPNYNELEVAPTTLNIVDRVFNKQNTIDGISQGLLTLQDSLDNLTLPILGSLEGKAPQFINIFARSLANELRNSPVITFDVLNSALNTSLEEALAQDNGINDRTRQITVQITDLSLDNISFLVGIKADYDVFSVPLGADLGLSGLGIGIQTEGSLDSNFSYNFNLGFGIQNTVDAENNIDTEFYIDTEKTSFTVGADLGLSDDFTAVGNLGFLRLDFANGESTGTAIDTELVVTLADPDPDNEAQIPLTPAKLAELKDTRLTLAELTRDRGANSSIVDFIEYGFRGDASLDFDVKTSIEGNTAFPSFSFNLASELPLFNYSNQIQANDTASPMLTVTQGLVTTPNNRVITGTPFTLTVRSDNQNSDTRLTKGTELVFQGSQNDTPTTVVLDRTVILSPNNPQQISVVIPVEEDITSVDVNIGANETATLESSGFNLSFNEITLDLGSFITNIVSPVIRFTNQIIDPIRPVINTLTTNIEFLSAIGLAGQFDRNGDNRASLIEVAAALSANRNNLRYTEFFDAVANIIDLINALDQLNRDLANGANIAINFGDYTLENFTGASETNTADKVDVNDQGTNNLNNNVQNEVLNPNTNNARLGNSIGNFFTKLNRMGVQLPILQNPLNAIKLFLGQDVDLVTYKVPDLNLNFNLRRNFRLFGPVSGVLEGNFAVNTDLEVGFDTNGFSQWRDRDFNLRDSYLTLDGFYVNDLDSRGFDKNELSLNASLEAGASLNAILASASVSGGIRGNAYLDLIDVGEYNRTADGRIRASEIASRINNPTSLFELSGQVDAFLRAVVELGFGRLKRTFNRDLASVNLFRFSVGGNIRGTMAQSYMQGSKVFWDANFDGIHNEDEPFAYTDETGFYDLDVPLTVFDLDQNGILENHEGRLVAVGGIDTSSRLTYQSPFYASVDSSMITPLTTLKSTLMDLGMSAEVAEGYIKDSLKLADEVNIDTFDPILALQLDDMNGLKVYGSHVKIKSILEFTNSLTGAFSQTVGINLNDGQLFEFVTTLINDIVMNQETPDVWENVEILTSEYGATLAQFFLDAGENSPIAEEYIPTVVDVWAKAVALASGSIASALMSVDDLSTAVESLVPIKMKLQDKLVTLMENMGNGTVSPDDSLITLENLFSDDPTLLLTDTLTRFQKTDPFGIYILAGEEESSIIREEYPVFAEEGEAFSVSFTPDDQLIRINRFQHESGGYLYAGEEESVSVRENYPVFEEEGIAFYALDANANLGVDIYRFRNSEVMGSYLFVGEEEKDSIIANYPQYVLEGVAFEVVL